MTAPDPDRQQTSDDAAKAVRFMLFKAAIFIGIPLIAAVVAALAIVMR